MKGFGTFDTTNSVYGGYYQKEQDPINNIPVFKIPEDEAKFYEKTLEMRKNYFDRYAHIYQDNNKTECNNTIDSKEFKRENEKENMEEELCQRPLAIFHEMPEKDVSKKFPKFENEF